MKAINKTGGVIKRTRLALSALATSVYKHILEGVRAFSFSLCVGKTRITNSKLSQEAACVLIDFIISIEEKNPYF